MIDCPSLENPGDIGFGTQSWPERQEQQMDHLGCVAVALSLLAARALWSKDGMFLSIQQMFQHVLHLISLGMLSSPHIHKLLIPMKWDFSF